MATPKTQGFSLSALPRSPSIPDNIGRIDVKAIDDAVRRGLDTFEYVRRAPQAAVLADEAAATDIAQQQAQRAVLPTQTQATLADIPNKSAILAGQAQVAQAQIPAQIGAIDRQAQAQAQAAQQFADFTDAYANAQGLADYAMKAQELETLPVKFPWLTQVPEYKTLLSRIADSTQAARTAAQQQSTQGAAVELAKVKAAGTQTPDQRLLNNLILLKQQQVENPDDPYLAEQIEQTQQLLNKKQDVSRVDSAAKLNLQKQLGEAKNQTLEQRNKMAFAKQEAAANQAVVAAEVNADHVNSLVDNALEKVGPLTVGFGATTLSKLGGTDGADLRALRETLKSIIGFQTLNELRNLSATGGAVGNVSDADLKALQNSIANLDQDQSVKQFKDNLEIIRTRMRDISARRKDAYNRQFGPEAYQRIFGTTPPTAATVSPDAVAAPSGEAEFKIIEVR